MSSVEDGGSYSIFRRLRSAFAIKFLNSQSIAPIEIHRQLCHQSFLAYFPLLVAKNCHGAPVVPKIVRQVGAKATVVGYFTTAKVRDRRRP